MLLKFTRPQGHTTRASLLALTMPQPSDSSRWVWLKRSRRPLRLKPSHLRKLSWTR